MNVCICIGLTPMSLSVDSDVTPLLLQFSLFSNISDTGNIITIRERDAGHKGEKKKGQEEGEERKRGRGGNDYQE